MKPKRTPKILMLTAVACAIFSIHANAQTASTGNPKKGDVITGTAEVTDGDTIKVNGVKIRFFGIDAPESAQWCYHIRTEQAITVPWRCGIYAKEALSRKTIGQPVSCTVKDIDTYKRAVSVCSVGTTDLNAWMVENGYAVAYVQYSGNYMDNEARARNASRGIWASQFLAPWDYRKSIKSTATQAKP